MRIGSFNTDEQILIVAEIGNNHEGSYALAKELIGLAKEAGADAVKFQTFKTEYYVSRKDEERYKRLKSFELTEDEFRKLSKTAQNAGLIFISTPLDIDSVLFLKDIVAAYKIASGDNNFYPLITQIAKTGKPIIISSGLADIKQLRFTKAFIEQVWQDSGIEQSLAILHCVTSYPVKPSEANLSAIIHLKEELQCTIGYSDHTIGIDAPLISVALGARIIEKHFTMDKNYSNFRDHKISADPQELSLLVQKTKEILMLLGSGEKVLQKSEHEIKNQIRRSIVAKRDLPEGKVIAWSDITWIRPAAGLPPGNESLILGKTVKRSIKMGEPIVLDNLDDKR